MGICALIGSKNEAVMISSSSLDTKLTNEPISDPGLVYRAGKLLKSLHKFVGNRNDAVINSSRALKVKPAISINSEFVMTLSPELRNVYRYYLLFNSIKQGNGKLFIKEALQISGRSIKQLSRILKAGHRLFWIDRSENDYLIIWNSNLIVEAMKEATKDQQTWLNRKDRTFAYVPSKDIKTLKGFTDTIVKINAEAKNKGKRDDKKNVYVTKYRRNGVVVTGKQQNKAIATIAKQVGYSTGKVCGSLKDHKGKGVHYEDLTLPGKETPYYRSFQDIDQAMKTEEYSNFLFTCNAKPLIQKTKGNRYKFVKRIANTYRPTIKTKIFRIKKSKCALPDNQALTGAYIETRSYSNCFLGIVDRLKDHYNLIVR